MKKIFFTLIIICNILIANAQHPFKQNLKNIATITFPDTPEVKQLKVATGYLLKAPPFVYYAQVAEVEKGWKDLIDSHMVDSLYDNFLKGNIESTKGKVFYKNNTTIEGLKGLEFAYKYKIANKDFFSYHQVVYLNDTLVNYMLLTADSLPKNDQKITSFFNTFKITTDFKRQTNGQDMAYKIGRIIGALLFIGSVIGIGFLIIFLIRKIASKNKVKQQ